MQNALRLVLLLCLASAGSARAEVHCTEPVASGWRECRAAIAQPLTRRMLQTQERSRWCWAAAVSMVFARYGHALPQEQIVAQTHGELANRGMPTHQLLAALQRDWSSNGELLRASIRHQVADPGATLPASATLLISSLAREHPLILSSNGHAVVVVGIAYEERGPWLRIKGATVIDPSPGVGLRPLAGDELDVALLASVEVMPVAWR
ncbi:papain-like cysteine protease family protein [Ramlibacter sp. PS3R-8]|uniref:papain-like cysteine protease family protein n=1 Tax=Ramlibacter sp. PS3R-8 TaxID=3133437 RepID=UPI0030B0FDD3